MGILFFKWSAFMEKGIEKAINELNIEYDVFYYDINNWDNDEDLEYSLLNYILNNNRYDSVLSVNFSPIISDVCNKLKIKYISWVYDCPINIRRTETLKNECNIIYFFDRIQANNYLAEGVRGARHMPLAVDTSVFLNMSVNNDNEFNDLENNSSLILRDNTQNKLESLKDSAYMCDVALVGKLYKSDYSYIYQYQDEYTRGYLDAIVSSQGKIYGGYIIDECINNTIISKINENFSKVSNGTYSVLKSEVTYALATEVTRRERYMVLSLLQSRYNVNLYSNDSDEHLNKVNNKGYVDYYTQMPKAFYNAKVNLNMSLKAIQSGIPLRVLDVLGCGGFLITNYQHEIAEYFEAGRELVIYEDIPDLVSKVQYYLTHEDERLRIAKNGYEKVNRDFTFKDKIEKMLKLNKE